jgi:hypothetical protein
LKGAIGEIIFAGHPFKKWRNLLKAQNIHLAAQPKLTELTQKQTKPLQTLRNAELVYTVAGQKAYFRAIIDAFYGGQRRDKRHLHSVMSRANKLVEGNRFSRRLEESNPFLGVLIDQRGRMSYAESVVDCARKLVSVALGSGINEEAILQEYESFSDRPRKVVKEYWAEAKKALS